MQILQTCPSHMSDVATLPWEIKKSHFRQYYKKVDVLGTQGTCTKVAVSSGKFRVRGVDLGSTWVRCAVIRQTEETGNQSSLTD